MSDTNPLGTPCSASDPFTYWQALSDRSEWVEPPNARRRGTSGVKRVALEAGNYFVKQQLNHRHFSIRHPLGRPTALREAEALEAAHRLGITAPQIAYCGARKTSSGVATLLVTRELRGFTDLDDFLAGRPRRDDAALRAALIKRLAATLGVLHRARWQHSALYPKHIFVAEAPDRARATADVEIALIDLEKCRRRPSARQASRHDIDQLQRHFDGFDNDEWRRFFTCYATCMGAR